LAAVKTKRLGLLWRIDMDVLVTGGAGFIGSHIVRELVDKGHNVKVLDHFATGKRENLPSNIEPIGGDIRNADDVKAAVSGTQFIMHHAAMPSVQRSVENPVMTAEVNIIGTLNLLRAARDAGVERFIFASSSSVYGNLPKLPKQEDMRPEPASPYAITKLACEQYCSVFHRLYGIGTVCLRYFNVFGPRQNPLSEYAAVIPKFIYALKNGRRPVIFGDGEQSRDFTYVKNVVNANMLAMKANGADGKVFNIASGKRITLNGFVEKLNQIMGKDVKPEYMDARKGDVKHSLADISMAREILGYEPGWDFEKGLRETVKWYANEHERKTG
jgi:nucleoside-diphosphate-sugar epimerase